MTTTYAANTTLEQAADLVRNAKSITITTHAKPDGDAFGSVVALASALQQLGKSTDARFVPPIPTNFRTLRGVELTRLYEPNSPFDPSDLVIIIDTGAWSQLSPMTQDLRAKLDHTLILDHHLSCDVDAAHRYTDGNAAAACEIAAQLLNLLDQSSPPGTPSLFNPTVADALFVGIASDTGWFRFSNTRPFTHELAARLQRLGVDHADLYQKLEQTERPEKLALLTRAMNSLQLLAGGRVALMTLHAHDFTQTGAMTEETERFIDMPQIVAGVQMVVLVTQHPGGKNEPIRVSFRSKPGPNAVDVSQFARRFGGGGHARASGAKIKAPLEQATQQIISALASLPTEP